jgi:hypothetical protein
MANGCTSGHGVCGLPRFAPRSIVATMTFMAAGFGLATLFRTVCKDKDCVIFHAPPLEEINGKTYKFDNKCYKYEPVPTKCDTKKKIISFT